jgi:Uma2 family endonuclease
MASVVHPRVETWEFDALQENRGWDMDYELIAGEAVLVPPVGESASMAQGELYLALRRWQDDTADAGVLLQDVFVAPPGKNRLAPPDPAIGGFEMGHEARRPRPRRRGALTVDPGQRRRRQA